MKKYIHTSVVIVALGFLASCSSASKVQQPKHVPQAAQSSAPMTVEAPANIDNMVYKERGEVIFTTGIRNSDGAYWSDDGGDGAHYGPASAVNSLNYTKTGAKTAKIARGGGHSGSMTFLRFSTPTSGYVYRYESFFRGEESVSNVRIPFTLERR